MRVGAMFEHVGQHQPWSCSRGTSCWYSHLALSTGKIYVLFLCLLLIVEEGMSIGCYYCVSRNNSDPTCSDPFEPAYGDYRPNCKSGKKNTVGLMPAHFCIKINGVPVGSDEELIIRTCSLRNMDYQCGMFEFEDADSSMVLMEGCILTCDIDGCNRGSSLLPAPAALPAGLLLTAGAGLLGWLQRLQR